MAESLLAAVRHCPAEEPVRSLLSAPHVAAEANKLGSSGVNALGLAVWRNHAGLVDALLEAGADPNTQDSESGWTALHRALHWGQLRIAAALLQADASLSAPVDWRGRTPLDLLSAELKEFLEPGDGDVFSWGNGSNYTLGTGSTDVQQHPSRIDSLHDRQVVCISAAKFHSAAITVEGQLLTWGWGRGGRLGHPEAHLHSGEGAVIAPHVVLSLGKRQVACVAAAKHHTVLCTTAGEVYTMGSNRHGQLGYAVDSQPTPRRVSSLRQRVVAVAAANKHSVAVTTSGEVFTWGCNVLGQLGYGTSDSTSNAAPRLVEAMKGKPVVAAAAAKRHTLVLTAAGEVYTWGHRGVSPRRVQLAGVRDALSVHGTPISFHRGHAEVTRPVALAICAGAAHSAALTATGVVLCWRSADPALQVQEVGGALAGKKVVSIAAGKYRTAAVSDEGDVYMWEGRSDYFPAEGRQPGSGSKKPPSASKARPIPGSGGSGMRMTLGGEHPLEGSYGSADVSGGGFGGGAGSYGSHSRRAGSFFERFARERELGHSVGPGSFGAAGGGGGGSSGRPEFLGSGGKGRGGGDVFHKIQPYRAEGLKRAVAVAVGEKHSLAVQRWSAAQLEGLAAVPWLQQPTSTAAASSAGASGSHLGLGDDDESDRWYQQAADGLGLADSGGSNSQLGTPREIAGLEAEPSAADSAASPSPSASPGKASPVRPGPRRAKAVQGCVGVPTLQRICEEEVARRLVDPRTCLQVLEYADVAGADTLRAYCLAVAVCNLDAVLLEAGGAFEELAPHLLAELERLYKLRLAGASTSTSANSSPAAATVSRMPAGAHPAPEPAGPAAAEQGQDGSQAVPPLQVGSRLQPGRRPTAAAPWLGDEGWDAEGPAHFIPFPAPLAPGGAGGSSFRDRSEADAEAAVQRLLRTLQKKVQQIEHLEAKAAAGASLDAQQRCKLEQKPVILSALAALEGGMALDDVHSILQAAAAGREAAEQLGAGSSASGSGSGSGAKAGTPAGAGTAGKKGKKGSQKPPLPGDAAGQSAGRGGSGELLPAAVAAAAAVQAAPSEVQPEASSSTSGLLGSSPPASSLVPAFGRSGSAAAEQPHTPSAAQELPHTPEGQMKSLVGFASNSASDGVAAVAALQGGEQQPQSKLAGSSGKPKSSKQRKGGLSMFLRGELEQSGPAAAAAAVTAAAAAAAGPSSSSSKDGGALAAPAWGARAVAPQAGATSLKEILDQEAAAGLQESAGKPPPVPASQRTTPSSGIKARSGLDAAAAAAGPAAPSPSGPLRLSLASFMQTAASPAGIQRRDSASPPPPAWGGAAGSSPPGRQTSFRAIQEEQEALHPVKVFGTSPPAVHRVPGMPPWRPPVAPGAAAGGSAAGGTGLAPGGASLLGTSPLGGSSLLGTSPSGRASSFIAAPVLQQSKWYVPEGARADPRKSLVSIQSEEEALQELARKYGSDNVRLVGKPPPTKAAKAPQPASDPQQPPPQQQQEAGKGKTPKATPDQQQQEKQQQEGRRKPRGPKATADQQQQQGQGGAAKAKTPRAPADQQQGQQQRQPKAKTPRAASGDQQQGQGQEGRRKPKTPRPASDQQQQQQDRPQQQRAPPKAGTPKPAAPDQQQQQQQGGSKARPPRAASEQQQQAGTAKGPREGPRGPRQQPRKALDAPDQQRRNPGPPKPNKPRAAAAAVSGAGTSGGGGGTAAPPQQQQQPPQQQAPQQQQQPQGVEAH